MKMHEVMKLNKGFDGDEEKMILHQNRTANAILEHVFNRRIFKVHVFVNTIHVELLAKWYEDILFSYPNLLAYREFP